MREELILKEPTQPRAAIAIGAYAKASATACGGAKGMNIRIEL